jgi:hypothetical protein
MLSVDVWLNSPVSVLVLSMPPTVTANEEPLY